MAGSKFAPIESGIDALRQDVFAALTAHTKETDGKIKAVIGSLEKDLIALLKNIDQEAKDIKHDIDELRNDVEGLKMVR